MSKENKKRLSSLPSFLTYTLYNDSNMGWDKIHNLRY